jgi:hypothetical protein
MSLKSSIARHCVAWYGIAKHGVAHQLPTPQARIRLMLQKLEAAQYDSWTQSTCSPAPAYVWLQCTELRDQDCYQAMLNEGIKGRPGPAFGAGKEYNRLELLMQPAVFDSMAAKLELFVAN